MAQRIRAMDWSATPLGPIDRWSPTLRATVRLMLANRFPHLLWWGPELIQLYNDAYIPVPGTKHPKALGQAGPRVLAGDLAHHTAADRDALQRRARDLDGRHPSRDPPARVPRGDSLHHRLQPRARRSRAARDRRRARHHPRDHPAGHPGAAPRGAGRARRPLRRGEDRRGSVRRRRRGPEPPSQGRPLCAGLPRRGGRLDGPPRGCRGRRARRGIGAAGGVPRRGWRARMARRCGLPRRAVGGRGRSRRPPLDTCPPGPWSDPPRQALVLPIPSNVPHRLAGLLVVGVSARIALDEAYRRLRRADRRAGRHGDRERARLRGGAAARGGAGRDRSGQDRVLLQREPRVPHAAHAAARPAGGGAGRRGAPTPRRTCARTSTVAHRNALRLLKLVNTLLDFSRIEAGRVEAAYEPVDLACVHRGARRNVSARRSSAPASRSGWTAPGSRSPSTWIATCGRRSSSTCSPTRSSTRSRERSRVSVRRSAQRVRARGARHRRRHPGRRSCPIFSSGSIACRTRARGPTRAPASGWHWCRSSSGCTAARSRSRARRMSARRSRSRFRPARRTCRRSTSSAGHAPRAVGGRGRAVCRGGAALAARCAAGRRRGPASARHGRAPCGGRGSARHPLRNAQRPRARGR